MPFSRLAAVLALLAAPAFADEVTPTRKSAGEVAGQIAGTTADSVTIKMTVTTVVRGKPKAEEKEETIPVIKGVVVKDAKGKEGKGDFNALAAPQMVKLKLAKETVRPVGGKPESRLVVTQIDVIHPKEKK